MVTRSKIIKTCLGLLAIVLIFAAFVFLKPGFLNRAQAQLSAQFKISGTITPFPPPSASNWIGWQIIFSFTSPTIPPTPPTNVSANVTLGPQAAPTGVYSTGLIQVPIGATLVQGTLVALPQTGGPPIPIVSSQNIGLTWCSNGAPNLPASTLLNVWSGAQLPGSQNMTLKFNVSPSCAGAVPPSPPTPPAPPSQALFDFGDAPASYPTKLAENGIRHPKTLAPSPWLGEKVDYESDANPTDLYDDGAVNPNKIKITTPKGWTSGTVYLNILIDNNKDGDWADSGEWVIQNQQFNPPGSPTQNTTTTYTIPNFSFNNFNRWTRVTATLTPIPSPWFGQHVFGPEAAPIPIKGETEDYYKKPGIFSGLVQGVQNLLGIGQPPIAPPAVAVPGIGVEPIELGPFNFDLPSGFPDDIPSDGQPDPPLAFIHMNFLLPPYNLWPIRLEPDGSSVCAPEADCDDPNDPFVFGINTRDRDNRNDNFSFTVSNSSQAGENIQARLILLGGLGRGGGSGRDGTSEAVPMARAGFNILGIETGYRISAKALEDIPPIVTGSDGARYYAAKFKVFPPSGASAANVSLTLTNPVFKMSGSSVPLFANAIGGNPGYTFANLLQEDPLPTWKQDMIDKFLNGIPAIPILGTPKIDGMLAKIEEAEQALAAAQASGDNKAIIKATIKLNLLNWIKLAIIGQIRNETMDLDMALRWVLEQWERDPSGGGGKDDPIPLIPFISALKHYKGVNVDDEIEKFLEDNQAAIDALRDQMQGVINNNGFGYGNVLNAAANLLSKLN